MKHSRYIYKHLYKQLLSSTPLNSNAKWSWFTSLYNLYRQKHSFTTLPNYLGMINCNFKVIYLFEMVCHWINMQKRKKNMRSFYTETKCKMSKIDTYLSNGAKARHFLWLLNGSKVYWSQSSIIKTCHFQNMPIGIRVKLLIVFNQLTVKRKVAILGSGTRYSSQQWNWGPVTRFSDPVPSWEIMASHQIFNLPRRMLIYSSLLA